MKKTNSFIKITIFTIVYTLLFANISFADDIFHQAKGINTRLSPILHINNQALQLGFNKLKPRLPLNSPSLKTLESYSLNDLTTQILTQCKSGNFSLLGVNWEKKHLDYQQFIKEAAAINTAINHFIASVDTSHAINSDLFIEKAINTRIEMIEKYQAPLSKKGLESIKAVNLAEKTADILKLLMNPPKEWFIPLFDEQRRAVLSAKCNAPLKNNAIYNPAPFTPSLVATWGCSTQCDHCDGGSVIEVTSFPWNWVEESQTVSPRYISRITHEPNLNGYFKDYYDLVYDKDASDIIMLTGYKFISTAAFAPGSVGERALRKTLQLNHIKAFQVSIAPSAWMRSIIQKSGIKEFIDHLKHIKSMVTEYNITSDYRYGKLTFVFALYDFARIDDDSGILREIFDYCYSENASPENVTIWRNGNFNRLLNAGLIDIKNMKSPSIAFREHFQDESLKDFIAKDVSSTALFPDGQVARVFTGSKKSLNRSYKTIPGLEPIGKEEINCWYCNKLDCPGNRANNCTGKSNVFKYHGLSENGGFNNGSTTIAQSI